MRTINTGDSADRRTAGSLHRDGSVAREYWLYVWPEHPYLKGRPAEYSNQPIKMMAHDIKEAAYRAHEEHGGAIKWELYLGSGWAGNAPLATYTKPLNAEVSDPATKTP